MAILKVTLKRRKTLWFISGILTLFFLGFYFKSLSYLGFQFIGQMQLIARAKPIEELTKTNYFKPEHLAKIKEIERIKHFAFNKLGLNPTNSYTTFVDLNDKPALWVVTAADSLQIRPYKWQYPILGKLSYKGFFNEKHALEEAHFIEQKGFDVCVGKVDAWSTLGLLPDPILSSFLNKPIGDLARLIIHELSHASVFVPNNTDFNENVASFFGNIGAKWYVLEHYGKKSFEMLSLDSLLTNNDIFTQITMQYADSLKGVYASNQFSYKVKIQLKTKLIERYKNEVCLIDKRFTKFCTNDWTPKNCFFTDLNTYLKDQVSLKKQLDIGFNGHLPEMIKYYKQHYASHQFY